MSEHKDNLVIFDVDGTLFRGDSMFAFLHFLYGRAGMWMHLPRVLYGWLGLLARGCTDAGRYKERLLGVFLSGMSKEKIEDRAAAFGSADPSNQYYPDVYAAMCRHIRNGDWVVWVSASLDLWMEPMARREGSSLICTVSRWDGRGWSGFSSPNCKGREKVRRIRQSFDTGAFDALIAYGNLPSDRPLLEMADEAWVCKAGKMRPFEEK